MQNYDDVLVGTKVEDLGDGTYAVTFTATVSGIYLIHIAKNGQVLPFSGERRQINVTPAALDGKKTSDAP
jgi:hypothetical protein